MPWPGRVGVVSSLGRPSLPHVIGKESSNLRPRISLLSWRAWFSWRTLGRKWGSHEAGGDHGFKASVKLKCGVMGGDKGRDSHGSEGQKV